MYSPEKVNKRQFEVQVQGQFKKVPEGVIYVGADAVLQLELGLLTRTFVKAVLSFLKTLVHNLHFSFGDSTTQEGYETAHVVAPLFSTMDKIVVTSAGKTPPPMGVPFPDDLELRKRRLDPTQCEDIEIIPGATYSFSLNSNNIDLPEWKVIGVPMLKPLSINMFSGGGPFSLVAYEVPRDATGKRPVKHSCDTMKYILNMQMASVDRGDTPVVEFINEETFDDVQGARRSSIKRLSSIHSIRAITARSTCDFELVDNDNDTGADKEGDESSSSSSGEEEDEEDSHDHVKDAKDDQNNSMNSGVAFSSRDDSDFGQGHEHGQQWRMVTRYRSYNIIFVSVRYLLAIWLIYVLRLPILPFYSPCQSPSALAAASRPTRRRKPKSVAFANMTMTSDPSLVVDVEETKVKKLENWLRRELSGRFLGADVSSGHGIDSESKSEIIVSNDAFMEVLEGDLRYVTD